MGSEKIVFTFIDEAILHSYEIVVDGLAAYLGTGCEVVLHSLADLDCSVVKIVNGEHTGRKAGAPITDLALSMLSKISQSEEQSTVAYFTTNRKGEPLKACTIAIRGENNRIIGLLCINYYLNTPLYDVLNVFSPSGVQQIAVRETFANDTQQLLKHAVEKAIEEVDARSDVRPSLYNRAIIEVLFKQGVFNMKDAVILIAQYLNISKNTVYMHLRHFQ